MSYLISNIADSDSSFDQSQYEYFIQEEALRKRDAKAKVNSSTPFNDCLCRRNYAMNRRKSTVLAL